jgi:hypothetical protein
MVASQFGVIDEWSFRNALHDVRNNQQISLVGLFRTITLEAWLRHICGHGVLEAQPAETKGADPLSVTTRAVS